VAGPLSGAGDGDARLQVARLQDAAAWLTIAVALALAPWGAFWDALALERPDPPGAFVAAGVVLAAVAAAHALRGGRRAVAVALAADGVGAAALVAWLAAGGPQTGALGAVVLAVTAASLALQAGFDAAMLRADTA
jgi:hypothetical protein